LAEIYQEPSETYERQRGIMIALGLLITPAALAGGYLVLAGPLAVREKVVWAVTLLLVGALPWLHVARRQRFRILADCIEPMVRPARNWIARETYSVRMTEIREIDFVNDSLTRQVAVRVSLRSGRRFWITPVPPDPSVLASISTAAVQAGASDITKGRPVARLAGAEVHFASRVAAFTGLIVSLSIEVLAIAVGADMWFTFPLAVAAGAGYVMVVMFFARRAVHRA